MHAIDYALQYVLLHLTTVVPVLVLPTHPDRVKQHDIIMSGQNLPGETIAMLAQLSLNCLTLLDICLHGTSCAARVEATANVCCLK